MAKRSCFVSLDISPSPFRSARKRRVKRGEKSPGMPTIVSTNWNKFLVFNAVHGCSSRTRTFSADVPTLESCSALVSPRVCSALPKALQVDSGYIYGEPTGRERRLVRRSPEPGARSPEILVWSAQSAW